MSSFYNAVCVLSWISLIILCVLVRENARVPAREKRVLYLTYATIAIAELAEWTGLFLNGRGDRWMDLLTVIKCADYILTPMVGGVLIAQMRIRNLWSRVIVILLACNTVFQIVSAFNGWVFFIGRDNRYSVGPLYPVYLGISLAVVGVATVQFILYGRKYRRQNQGSLYLILVLVLASVVMQEILPSGSRILYLGITIAMALLYIHVSEYSQLAADDFMTEQMVKINTDALTGLYSRHAYSQALDRYNEKRVLPERFAVFSLDLNGLKSVNDSLGHEAGDELIKGAARCIEETLSRFGICYRTGGDEFIVMGRADREEAEEALRLLEERTGRWRGQTVQELRLAVGFALAKEHPEMMAEKLVNEADHAMYAAKADYYQRSGKRRRGADE